MIILLQALPHRHEVQTLEAGDLDDVVLEPPVLCLERHDEVDILQQPRDRVCRRAVRVGNGPEDVRGGEAVALDRQAQTHRCGALRERRSATANFWRSYDGLRRFARADWLDGCSC